MIHTGRDLLRIQLQFLDNTVNYEFIGFRSNSGALYIDEITIVWEKSTSSAAFLFPSFTFR